MKRLKQISEKLKELYATGLSKNQKILVFVVLGLVVVNGFLLLLSFRTQSTKTAATDVGSRLHLEPDNSRNYGSELNSEPTKEHTAIDGKPVEEQDIKFIDQVDPPQNKGDNPVSQLPEIKNSSIQSAENLPPGPMDTTIAKIKEDYKNNPKYNLILDYLEPLKEIADGKRAWNGMFRENAAEFLGENKAREIENEIKKINGNKEEKIRQLTFNTLEEVTAAIKKDTEKYIEKEAINGFLEHAKAASDDKYPWSDTARGLGEINLEKAWVDKIDGRVRPVKEAKARRFQAKSYANLDQLIAAIKEDTKNYEQTAARDMFLDYMKELGRNNALTTWDIDGGGNLLEDYHLAELKKFVNN